MRTDKPAFDAALYKQNMREQWDKSAESWYNERQILTGWLESVTNEMLNMAELAPGQSVLDIAAGAGQQSVLAAERVGPSGRVLATDISENILRFADETARQAGLTNIETRVLDGESLDTLEPDSFDAVICRLGLMLFPNCVDALAGMYRVLKPGGKISVIVFSIPEHNPYAAIPNSIIHRRAGVPMPAADQPGIFSLAKPGVLESAFEQAGFRDVQTKLWKGTFKTATTADYLRFIKESAGPFQKMLAGFTAEEERELWDEMTREAKKYEVNGEFHGPSEHIIGAATK